MLIVIDNVEFVCNEDIPIAEAREYVIRGREKYGSSVYRVRAEIDGDEVDLNYDFPVIPFDRVRRITGYLVGTLDRFNDAKRAEESDRVKHEVDS